MRLYEELSEWSGEESSETASTRFSQDGSLTAAVRERAESFELFCLDADDEASRALLAGVPFGDAIERVARRYRVDALLIASMIEAESQFDPLAISPVGAIGLMQLMPETGLELGVEDLTDPYRNLEAGARYLRQLLQRFDGDLALALAAYNAGPTRVVRYGDVPPIRETTEYVEKVLRRYLGHRRVVWQAETGPAVAAALVPERGAGSSVAVSDDIRVRDALRATPPAPR
ncbi:MAG TPA: lytic transglycosylase domain-containing protein [Thermoanaerobaculia bacterium]|nr:lytic transglycosylase domain-containing protein [Thermoanaerobaculia bacterium]